MSVERNTVSRRIGGEKISAPPEIRNPIPRFISHRLLAVHILTDVFQRLPAYYGINQIIGCSMYWRLYR